MPRSSAVWVEPHAEISSPAPARAIDEKSALPRFGTYRGAVETVDLAPLHRGALGRLLREKQWLYAMITADPWLFAVAVVDLGYLRTAFGFAYRDGVGLEADLRTVIGLPMMSRVRQDPIHRIDARLRGVGASVRAQERRSDPVLEVFASTREFEIRASFDLAYAAPALTAIAPIRGGAVNITEKRALAPVRGAALVRGERIPLDGALGGYDFTMGLPGRETRWNWAFCMGEAEDGTPFALNCVEGFVGAPECAVFIPGAIHALGPVRFELPGGPDASGDRSARARALAPWRIRAEFDGWELVFQPGAVHDETLDVRVLASRFVQPVGRFSGTLRCGSRVLQVRDVLGVVEDQDVQW